MQNFDKDWQVETRGQVYLADLEELKQWIAEGAVLPSDKVKRGKLRWLTAEKVPELCNSFYSYNLTAAFSHAVSVKFLELEYAEFQTQFVFEVPLEEEVSEWNIEKFCYVHCLSDAVFACDSCQKSFCKICPKSYGGNVKICFLCGALCRTINETAKIHKSVGAINKPYSKTDKNTGKGGGQNQSGFQRPDFVKAFAYSLKYLKSVIRAVKITLFPHLERLRHRE
jgi:hypothetical protein